MEVKLLDQEGRNVVDDTEGDDSVSRDAADAIVSPAHARATWERFRRQGRAAGMSRKESVAYATREVERLHPPPPGLPPLPPVVVAPDPPAAAESPAAPETPLPDSGGGVAGLGDLPADWPVLPANASLQAEVAWVQANRLRVRRGEGVDLSLSLGPAPSHAALSWLETSILFPSKFADVTVKATADQQADQEDVRREKAALGEVRSLLAESSSAAE